MWYTELMEKLQLLPLGVQYFSILREGDYLYVDKTSLFYELTHTQRAVFLSRRFGKSLLLSAIKYYFLGRKDLFSRLAIDQLEEQGYAAPYSADKRKLFKIGVNFSSAERNIIEWEVL